ncbi:MAG TPA: FAD-dependent oxidoreductase [Terriglobales bacterium]|nr:FAD-dependent oxidoreductase [Terriglobales bacterium]
MPEYLTEFKHKEDVAAGTMAFHFRKPDGFQFRAGQAIDVTLIDPPETDAEGNTRAFSIASAPSDPDLVIATRMRNSAFKRVLKVAGPGLKVKLDGPTGSLTLHKNSNKSAVFLAGGIGITPFRSMARDAASQKLPHEIFLFYSNRRPVDAAFLQELQQLQRTNPHFHLVATMTKTDKSQLNWSGDTGYLTAEKLQQHLSVLQGPIYYIAGPPSMVAAMRTMLIEAAVDEDDIRTEDFAGY